MSGHSSPADAPEPVRRGSIVLVLIVLLMLVLVISVVVVRYRLQTREGGGFASSEPLIFT